MGGSGNDGGGPLRLQLVCCGEWLLDVASRVRARVFAAFCRILSDSVASCRGRVGVKQIGDCGLMIARLSPWAVVWLSAHGSRIVRGFCIVKFGAGGDSRLRGNDVGGCGNDVGEVGNDVRE